MTQVSREFKRTVQTAVERGSILMERVQKDVARVPFDALEQIPLVGMPIRGFHKLHDASVEGVHGILRLINGAAGEMVDVVLDAIEGPLIEAVPLSEMRVLEPAPSANAALPSVCQPEVDGQLKDRDQQLAS